MTPKLKYVGKQFTDATNTLYIRLWDLHNSPCPEQHPDGSSVSLYTLKKIGVVRR